MGSDVKRIEGSENGERRRKRMEGKGRRGK